MNIFTSTTRLHDRFQRSASRLIGRRCIDLRLDHPIISFTFDDFPQSALGTGGAILGELGVAATFYVALDLLGRRAPVGQIVSIEHIREVLTTSHELGCHTFSHCHAWETKPREFEESIVDNRNALDQLAPGAVFETHAYPISSPRPRTKQKAAKYYFCARGGGQSFNVGRTDLNLLKAFFLEKSRGDLSLVKDIIERNSRAKGWLIFATHDVSENPSNFGCTPSFLREVVNYAVDSGAMILPVGRAFKTIRHNGFTEAKGAPGQTNGAEARRLHAVLEN